MADFVKRFLERLRYGVGVPEHQVLLLFVLTRTPPNGDPARGLRPFGMKPFRSNNPLPRWWMYMYFLDHDRFRSSSIWPCTRVLATIQSRFNGTSAQDPWWADGQAAACKARP